MDPNKWINRASGQKLMVDPQTRIRRGLERVAKDSTENTFLERRDLAKSRAIRTRWKDRRKDIFFSLSLSQPRIHVLISRRTIRVFQIVRIF